MPSHVMFLLSSYNLIGCNGLTRHSLSFQVKQDFLVKNEVKLDLMLGAVKLQNLLVELQEKTEEQNVR